jgi:hypothetical protein
MMGVEEPVFAVIASFCCYNQQLPSKEQPTLEPGITFAAKAHTMVHPIELLR